MTWDDYNRLRAALDRDDAMAVATELDGAADRFGALRVPLTGLHAQALARLGRPAAAIAALRTLVASGLADYWTHHLLAQNHATLGDADAAAAAYRAAHAQTGWPESLCHGYAFTHDYFSANIATWQEWFAVHVTAAPLAALEIGSWQGGSACWLLDKVIAPRGGHLTCIDTFGGSSEHQGMAAISAGALEARFDANIARTGRAAQVRKLVGPSQTMLPRLAGESFDFIYIDGAHEAKFVIQDAVLCWGLLRVGGFLLFDDVPFAFAATPEQDTRHATDFFLSVFRDDVEVIAHARQLLLRRIRL